MSFELSFYVGAAQPPVDVAQPPVDMSRPPVAKHKASGLGAAFNAASEPTRPAPAYRGYRRGGELKLE